MVNVSTVIKTCLQVLHTEGLNEFTAPMDIEIIHPYRGFKVKTNVLINPIYMCVYVHV